MQVHQSAHAACVHLAFAQGTVCPCLNRSHCGPNCSSCSFTEDSEQRSCELQAHCLRLPSGHKQHKACCTWQHLSPDHGVCVQVLPSGTSQNLQACMGSSRMGCQLIFLMTLPHYASRYCWARYFEQHFHVTSAQWCSTHCKHLFLGCGHNCATHC